MYPLFQWESPPGTIYLTVYDGYCSLFVSGVSCLKVYDKPPSDMNYEFATKILFCKTSSSSVIFCHGGVPITSDAQHVIEGTTLTFTSLKKADSGMYTCLQSQGQKCNPQTEEGFLLLVHCK